MSKLHRPVETDNSNTTCIGVAPHRIIQFASAMRWIMSSGCIAQNPATHPKNFGCRDLSGKFLVFKIGGPLGEMVAYRALSHREVRLWLFLNFVHRALH